MTDKIGLVILAAGQGKRLNSDTPKPLLPLMGRKLIDYPLLFLERFVHSLDIQGHIGIVVGHAKEEVIQHIGEMKKTMKTPCILAHQNEQKGTANALKAYMATPQAASVDTIVVVCADTPLMTLEDLQLLHRDFKQHRCDAVLASFKTSTPKALEELSVSPWAIVLWRKKMRIVTQNRSMKSILAFIFSRKIMLKNTLAMWTTTTRPRNTI